jgi:DNA-directed RNA polymerase specialized sigma subunit
MKVKLTPKQYLNQAYRLNELIESHIAELRMLRETMDGLSAVQYDKDKVQTNNVSSPVENTVQKIMAQEEKINAEIDRFVDLKAEIHDEISKVPDPTEQLVLRLRYIQFKSWPDIQGILGKKERRAFVIHSTALNHFKVPETRFAYREI